MKNVLIAICTYNRNESLGELLDSLIQGLSEDAYSVVVIDNAPTPCAKDTVSSASRYIRYVHQPIPGIVAARNAALEEAEGADAIIFLDDDEIVSPHWYKSLLGYWDSTGADVVLGPVAPLLPDNAADWVKRGGFFDKQAHRTGTLLTTAATNNVLIDMSVFKSLLNPWFDESFSMSGGSDVELFGRIYTAGKQIHWCQEALVYERIPLERTSLAWILKRQFRVGNVTGRIRMQKNSRLFETMGGLARIGVGLARTAMRIATFRHPKAKDLGPLARGIGLLAAIFQIRAKEYMRRS